MRWVSFWRSSRAHPGILRPAATDVSQVESHRARTEVRTGRHASAARWPFSGKAWAAPVRIRLQHVHQPNSFAIAQLVQSCEQGRSPVSHGAVEHVVHPGPPGAVRRPQGKTVSSRRPAPRFARLRLIFPRAAEGSLGSGAVEEGSELISFGHRRKISGSSQRSSISPVSRELSSTPACAAFTICLRTPAARAMPTPRRLPLSNSITRWPDEKGHVRAQSARLPRLNGRIQLRFHGRKSPRSPPAGPAGPRVGPPAAGYQQPTAR